MDKSLPPAEGNGGTADDGDAVAQPGGAPPRLRIVRPPKIDPTKLFGEPPEDPVLGIVERPKKRRLKLGGLILPGGDGTPDVDPPTRTRLKTLTLCAGSRRDGYKPADLLYQSILAEELALGTRFIVADGQPWIFDGAVRRMVPVSLRSPQWCAILTRRYGIMGGERLANNVTGMVQAYCHDLGERREVRRFSCFDQAAGILYLSRYNGECYRLDGETITTCPNGEAVFFVDDEGGVPVEAEIFHEEPATDHLFAHLVNDLNLPDKTDTGMTADQQRLLLKIWILCVGMPDLLVAKPLLLITGQMGSGKTSLAQRIQILCQGRDFPQQLGKNDQDDFGVTLLREAVAVIDNVDTVIDWLKDALCAYATSGGWRRRRKYSDDAVYSIRPQAYVALPTKNPASFRRDDIADRSLIISLASRRAGEGFHGDVLTPVKTMRPRIYGEWLFWLNKVVKEMRSEQTLKEAAQPVQHRLAGFALLSYVAGRVLGVTRGEVDRTLNAAQAERVTLTSEGDPLVDLLDRWLGTDSNEGRPVTAAGLFVELKQISEATGIQFYASHRTLITRLNEALAKAPGALTRYYDVRRTVKLVRNLDQAFYEIRRSS